MEDIELKIKATIDEDSYLEVERKLSDLYSKTHFTYITFFVGLAIGFAACAIATFLT